MASSTVSTARAEAVRPPKCPRVASDRMKTPSSVAWRCMRMRSPRMAPPEKGLVGSTAITPTVWSCGPEVLDEAVGEGAFPHPRGAGDAHDVGPAAVGIEVFQDLPGGRHAVVQLPHEPGPGPHLPGHNPRHYVLHMLHGCS
jgi:hypothetical protein